MEIKYTGMELKLHRHGIQTTLASVFGAMLIATPLVGDSYGAQNEAYKTIY